LTWIEKIRLNKIKKLLRREPLLELEVFKTLQGKILADCTLYLGEVKQLHLSGWKGFKLYLQNSAGSLSEIPVIKGIYSVGGKDGIKPWMDLEYSEDLAFSGSKNPLNKLSLSSANLDKNLFKYLGDVIPPGGHLMVSYEGDQRIHTDTIKSLGIGIPPSATPLGYLIFLAGFQYIKDWYLAEGGFEGPRKLWGEKAPDQAWLQIFNEKTIQQITQFLKKRDTSTYKELEEPARQRAKNILEMIQKHN